MADIVQHTFTVNGVMPGTFAHHGRFSQLTMGEVNAQNLGGGTLLIQKRTLNGSLHTIRSITSADFSGLQDRTLRLELPDESRIVVELQGATSPNMYIEHHDQKDVQ